MPTLTLRTASTRLVLSPRFGAVIAFDRIASGTVTPVLRPGPAVLDHPTDAAAFPMLPFCGRIAENRFRFADGDFPLSRNSDDPLRLHGDGWLADWVVERATETHADLTLRHAADADAPWDYAARQHFVLRDDGLDLRLAITNRAATALPYGLGWHPYLPLTAMTTLTAPANAYWTEDPGHLPRDHVPLPADLDFASAKPLPARWINNGFEGWGGAARVDWPERALRLTLTTTTPLSRYMLYRPGRRFDATAADDVFCFEPMSHAVDGFHHADLGGLTVLAPNETLTATISLTVTTL